MKKVLLLIVAMAALLVAGCQEQTLRPTFTAALLAGTNADSVDDLDEGRSASAEYVGRLGIALDRTELGFATHWFEQPDDPSQTYGIYVLQWLAEDEKPISTVAALLGRPYLGALVTVDLDDDGGLYGFLAGTSHTVGGIDVLSEFQARTYTDALKKLYGEDADRWKLFVGPRFRF